MERLHPQDVRTFVAAILTAGDWAKESVIIRADALLADLAATAPREPDSSAQAERERIIALLELGNPYGYQLTLHPAYTSPGTETRLVGPALRAALEPKP